MLARYNPGREPLSSLCPDCSRNCQHLTKRRIAGRSLDPQDVSFLRLDLTQKLQQQEKNMGIDLRVGKSTKEQTEILLVKSRFVVSRHSKIKASASVAVFSFDLATDSCPLKNVTSFSSFLTRSCISPNRRTSEEVRDVKLQDFRAAAVAAPSTVSWTENMGIKRNAFFSAKIQTAIGSDIETHFIKQKIKVYHLRTGSRH